MPDSTASESSPRAQHLELGERGEALALEHLGRAGYRVVAANFVLPIGRNLRDVIVNAEIDIVAYDGPTLCFVEVKARASDEFAPPQMNVDRRKQRQVARAARAYRRMFGLIDQPYRYDVVTIVSAEGDAADEPARVEVLKNFWTDEKLRKRSWHDANWK